MKIIMQFRTNVNYMATISDCLIQICNTHTITFGYQTHFLSQFTFKLHLARKAFDCLLWALGPGVMMVNSGTRIAPVNIAFSSSRNAALIERKVFQYTTLSIEFHHCTLIKIETQIFTFWEVLACVSIHCADQKHSNLDFLKKSIDKTLQTCVDIANEYLYTYNTCVGVKSHGFLRLHQCRCAGFTMFLMTFLLSNWLLWN